MEDYLLKKLLTTLKRKDNFQDKLSSPPPLDATYREWRLPTKLQHHKIKQLRRKQDAAKQKR
jgi:hypothetical protein